MKRNLSSWQMSQIARSPSAYMKFATQGVAPEPASPRSPLITLLLSLTPRERASIRAVTIDHRLGYTGKHVFETAAHALNWLSPSYPAKSYPSQSWQDKRFNKRLTLEDLLACSGASQKKVAPEAPQEEPIRDPEP